MLLSPSEARHLRHFPTLIPLSPSCGPGHIQCRGLLCTQQILCPWVSPGHRGAAQESSLGSGSSAPSPGGERDSRSQCHKSLSSLQIPKAIDSTLETLVLSCPASRFSKVLQNILQVWHVPRVGFRGAVPHPGGKGGQSPPQCPAEPAQRREGAHLPWVTRGCPPGSSRAQWPQRVASAFLPGHKEGSAEASAQAGSMGQWCEVQQGQALGSQQRHERDRLGGKSGWRAAW